MDDDDFLPWKKQKKSEKNFKIKKIKGKLRMTCIKIMFPTLYYALYGMLCIVLVQWVVFDSCIRKLKWEK